MVKRPARIVVPLLLSILTSPAARSTAAAVDAGAALTRRQREILDGIARHAPFDFPDRWLHELGAPPDRGRILRERMVSSISWIEFLAYANALDWSEGERAETHAFLLERFSSFRSGKTRQNVVFLFALTAPAASRSLSGILDGGGSLTEADRADIRCALAALGDPASVQWFEREFPSSEAFVGKPLFAWEDYEREERDEANRETVRSYRLWETAMREPYYKRLKHLARAGIYAMTTRETPAAERERLAVRLLEAFIAKWPGHPGADDCALRLMNHAIERRDLKKVFVWTQRASLLPDQDCASTALRILKPLVDSQLPVEVIDEAIGGEPDPPNRDFLVYERFIKTARDDAAAAIDWFDRVALADPRGLFAEARSLAGGVPPSAALRDGVREDLSLEIVRLYPERSRALAATPHEGSAGPGEEAFLRALTPREREVVVRTRRGRRRSIDVDPSRLARQYRLLLELTNLRRLEEGAADAESRADLRYRQGKLLYREPDLLLPLWADRDQGFGWALNAVRFDAEGDRRLETYAVRAFGLRRSYDMLASLLTDYPRYSGRDQALFHMAQAYAKLMDDKPAKVIDAWVFPDRPPVGSREGAAEYSHRRVGELFRRVVEEAPDSVWVDESERGAAYRFKAAAALRARREKEEKRAAAARGPREF